MLERAAAWLKPGGALVYAVCSLEPDEGEAVVAALPRRQSRLRESRRPQPGELPDFVTPDPRKAGSASCPASSQSEGGLDGFFIARLVRMAT